jgi:hypothetical protein
LFLDITASPYLSTIESHLRDQILQSNNSANSAEFHNPMCIKIISNYRYCAHVSVAPIELCDKAQQGQEVPCKDLYTSVLDFPATMPCPDCALDLLSRAIKAEGRSLRNITKDIFVLQGYCCIYSEEEWGYFSCSGYTFRPLISFTTVP